MTKPTAKQILLLEDEDDFREIMVRSRKELGIRKDDDLRAYDNSEDAKKFLGRLDRDVDIAVLDLVLNEKPSMAYARIKRPTEFEGIDVYESCKDHIQQTIFLTSAANYRQAVVAGFNFNQSNRQVCLKTNLVEARDEDRFPNNLIRAIETAYKRLINKDARPGETRDG
ncbi:MAG: hypothetical protein ABTR27_11210 [Candidatus Competibacter phosphatis]